MFNLISVFVMKTFSEFSKITNLALSARLRREVDGVMDLTGLQQRQIAYRCGIDPSNFSRILAGKISSSYVRICWIGYVCGELCAEFYASRN